MYTILDLHRPKSDKGQSVRDKGGHKAAGRLPVMMAQSWHPRTTQVQDGGGRKLPPSSAHTQIELQVSKSECPMLLNLWWHKLFVIAAPGQKHSLEDMASLSAETRGLTWRVWQHLSTRLHGAPEQLPWDASGRFGTRYS